jgi:hypothetical protein
MEGCGVVSRVLLCDDMFAEQAKVIQKEVGVSETLFMTGWARCKAETSIN